MYAFPSKKQPLPHSQTYFLTHKGIHVQKHFQLILKTPRVSKKTEKPIKPRKPEKNNRKNQIREEKPIKPIKILKKSTGSVSVL